MGQAGGGVASGAVVAGSPKFRVIRSISGTKGSQTGGKYVIEDPRSIFYVPQDSQVVIYFDWEGPIGSHHLEGFWKNPEGKVVSLSDFDYDAKQTQFGAYWTVPLSPQIEPGTWTLDVRIDGELAGSHNFQVFAGTNPSDGGAPARALLAPPEIYKRLLAATFDLEKRGASGERLGSASGFLISDGLLATTFQAIDGAASLHITSSDGKTAQEDGVVAWNRKQDWALLKVVGDWPKPLPVAPPNSFSVGDRCYSLNEPRPGNRVIVDGNSIGRVSSSVVGDRLNLSFGASLQADGSPIVNEYGETVGLIVIGSQLPGSWTLWQIRAGLASNLFKPGGSFEETLALPLDALKIPAPGTAPKAFADLSRDNQFTPILVGSENVERGGIGLHLDNTIPKYPDIRDEKFEFSPTDKDLVVLITWSPKSKIKAQATLAIYDLENHQLVETKPMKLRMSAGDRMVSTWTLNISTVMAATYRVDLDLDGQPCWRSYFRVVR